MKLRLQMLGIRGNDPEELGSLVRYGIQSLALDNLEPIASHLDAPACRKYAAQLGAFNAKTPSYAAILRVREAEELEDFDRYLNNPQHWEKSIGEIGLSATEQTILRNTPVAQIKANIAALYKVRLAEANQPYSSLAKVEIDPYNARYTGLFSDFRFLWTRAKTQRVLLVAALQARADRLEHKMRTQPLPADPFGKGPLQEKFGSIYSIGPDGIDDGGQFMVVYRSDEHGENGRLIPSVASKRMDYKGDIVAPRL